MIRYILKKLYFSEGTIVGTHRNNEMPNYWVFIDIIRGELLIMLIRGEIVKNTFTFIISDTEVVFPFCFKC